MGSMGTYGSISLAQIIQPGWWDCRNLVPYDKAKDALEEEYFEEDRQYAWVGDGGFMMHDILDNRKTVQCVGAVITDEA